MTSNPTKTIEFKIERLIPASTGEVFDAWLDPKIPGNPWNTADKLLLDPQVDGLFFWSYRGTPHYGRFTDMERPARIQHTWMSPNTSGLESIVTVTYQQQAQGTLMILVHSGLPDSDRGKSHNAGWNYLLGNFHSKFGATK